MEYTNIKFNIENGIAPVRRDDIRNAFSEEFTEEIVDAIELTQLSEDARVLVLSAEGSAFSAGKHQGHERQEGYIRRRSLGTRRGYMKASKVPKALYLWTSVNLRRSRTGNRRGLRSGALLRHRRRPKAKFGETFINVGIIPGDGGAWIVPRRVGLQRAAELIFTGRVVRGEEAAEIGWRWNVLRRTCLCRA